ncbi:hypothetical protein PoB_005530100 [Plakobranchus ocellatus]|uniref:Uncharacterized protein n=1 Tax=Plakobranchus ocellatus TaxID=259542 RepID=A0AAV4C099_9GAST|nr:hypothetical protein PoB_005530100 [Plakobranchus ocellatus]
MTANGLIAGARTAGCVFLSPLGKPAPLSFFYAHNYHPLSAPANRNLFYNYTTHHLEIGCLWGRKGGGVGGTVNSKPALRSARPPVANSSPAIEALA